MMDNDCGVNGAADAALDSDGAVQRTALDYSALQWTAVGSTALHCSPLQCRGCWPLSPFPYHSSKALTKLWVRHRCGGLAARSCAARLPLQVESAVCGGVCHAPRRGRPFAPHSPEYPIPLRGRLSRNVDGRRYVTIGLVKPPIQSNSAVAR